MATIKKIILLALAAVMMAGCEESRQEDITPEVTKSVVYSYRIMTIDSCEYIGIEAHGFSHKGNCRFCKERRKKELEELISQIKKRIIMDYKEKH